MVRRDPLEVPEGHEHAEAARVLVHGHLPSLRQAGGVPRRQPRVRRAGLLGVRRSKLHGSSLLPRDEAEPEPDLLWRQEAEAAAPGENVWFKAGHLFTGTEQRFTRDDVVYFTRKSSDTCYLPNGSTSSLQPAGFIFNKMLAGDYPILVGAKPGEIITIDYVRVWLAP